jgi:hypothetical protein
MIDTLLQQYEGFRYEILDANIHAIRFEAATRQAVTSLMTLVEHLYVQYADAGAVFLLVDSTSSSLPMGVAIREGLQLEKRYPQHPTIYVALLHTNSLAKLLDSMLRPLRINNQIRLFGPKEHDQAVEWLRTKQAEVARPAVVGSDR